MRTTNIVIDAVSATTTDHFALVNRVLYLGETAAKKRPIMNFLEIQPESLEFTAAGAATAQVDTFVTTNAVLTNLTVYSIRFTQQNQADGSQVTVNVPFQIPATGTYTRALLSALAVAAINGMDSLKVTAAVSTDDFTVTGQTGYEIFHSILVTGNGITVSTTTAGVYAFGKTPYYDLLKAGVLSDQYTGSTAGYSCYGWSGHVPMGENNAAYQGQKVKINLWINTDDGDAAALITAINVVWAQAAFNREAIELTIG